MHWKMKQTLNESKNHHIDETVKTAFKDFDMDSRVFLAKLKKFGFEKQYKKMLKNFDKHAKPGDGFYFIDGGRELGFQVHPVADMMMGPKIKKLGDTQDLGGGKTAKLIAIKEGVQIDENNVTVKFVVDADQNSYESITRDPKLKKLPGFLGLHNIVFQSRKKKAVFTFRKERGNWPRFEKLLKKHGLKLVDTIYEGSKKLDESKVYNPPKNSSAYYGKKSFAIVDRYGSIIRVGLSEKQARKLVQPGQMVDNLPGAKVGQVLKKNNVPDFYRESVHVDEQGPLGGGLTNPTLPFLPQVAQKQKTGKYRPGRREIGRRRPAPGLVNPGGPPIQFEGLAARDIQGMIKGLNKKAKQEIAGVLNDMNLSGYGDYEARADNVHKFKPKDLLKAMNKVMKLEQANIVEFNDKFMKTGKYASKQDKAHYAKKRKEFERELKKAGIKFHFVAGNQKGPVEDTYYVSFKNNQKAHQIANKLFAGAVFSSEIRRFGISAVSEVSFSEFSESVQLDEGSTIEFKFKNPMKAGAFMRRIMRDKLASEVDRYDGDRSPEEIVQVIMHPNDYERNDIERLAKQYKGELHEDLQIDEMSARDHYRRYKNKNRVSPIDRERFPNREREGLEGPYRTKKTGLIYYYDRKAGKYYDPQTDMYLDVDDIMESMGINEQKASTFVVELDTWHNPKRYANFLKDYGIVRSEKDYTIQRRKVSFKYKPVRGVSLKHIELLGTVLKNVGGKFRRIEATPEIEKTARQAHKKAKFIRDIADEDRKPIKIPKNFFDVDYEKIRRDHEDAVRRAQDESINESDHYSKKDLYTDKDIKKLSKAYGNESYKGGFRGDKEDLPGAVKQMLRYISNYSNNDLIVIALADIPHASTQAKIELKLLRGYEIKGRPPKKRSDFVKK